MRSSRWRMRATAGAMAGLACAAGMAQAQQQQGGDARPPAVAPLFEQPGVLTPRGKFVFEPSAQFGYSSSNRVVLVGYTIIPALLIGLVDVREVKRNTLTGTASVRYGLSNRAELELKLPYVYRSDSTVSREIFTGTGVDRVFETSGRGVGDAELALRYQLNQGAADKPYYVAGLRVKSRTGTDPFSVVTDCSQRCVGPNATGTGCRWNCPPARVFYAVQPSLTWLYSSDRRSCSAASATCTTSSAATSTARCSTASGSRWARSSRATWPASTSAWA